MHKFHDLTKAISLALLFCCGCSSGDRPQTVPVSGTITLNGALMPTHGSVVFTPVEAFDDLPKRPAFGDFDTDGQYRAMTFDDGDGIIPGRYTVRFDCWEIPPQATGEPGKSHIPESFRNSATSGVELVVEPDARSITFDYDIPKEP